MTLILVLVANSSWIGCRYQGLGARWREECRVHVSHAASLIGSVVNFIRHLEEHRTRRVHGHAAIAVSLRESAAFYNYHHGSRMVVPSGFAARLKHQLCLQYIARPLHVQVDSGVSDAEAFCQPDDLQPARVATRNV